MLPDRILHPEEVIHIGFLANFAANNPKHRQNMKKTLFFLAALLPLSLSAQEESAWTHEGLTGINFSQTSFTNWSEGGENSMAGNVYFNGSLNYKEGKNAWDNNLSANYGMNYTDATDWRKNIDNLNLSSKFGRQITEKLYYAALFDFKTQMANGYQYNDSTKEVISKFLTPGYLNLSVGLDYKPNEHISLYYSPVAGKMTLTNDTLFSTRYGVDAGQKTRFELGSSFKGTLNYSMLEDKLTLKSTLDLFTAYNESFGNVDVNWDVLVGLNVTSLLTVTFQSTLKYDDDIKYIDADGGVHGARVQFKEILGVGLSYKF